MNLLLNVLVFLLSLLCSNGSLGDEQPSDYDSFEMAKYEADCQNPQTGLYTCKDPEIDKETHQPFNCTKRNKVNVTCSLRRGFYCKSTNETTFLKEIDCLYTNGYHFETALLLSIFLGKYKIKNPSTCCLMILHNT